MTHKHAGELPKEAAQHSWFRADLSFLCPEAAATFKENMILKKIKRNQQKIWLKRKDCALKQEGSFWISPAAAWRVKTDVTHPHTHAHAGFFEELWCFVVTPAHLAGGGLNMGSIMMFDRSSQVDGVDSFRWAENGGFPGLEWLQPLLIARISWFFF